MTPFDVLIVGQGLAGTALAWALRWRGARVLVADREAAGTSSRVAAGLVTPVTGQRLSKTWRLDVLWPAAVAFYDRAEAATGVRFFRRARMARLFRDAAERELFDRRADGQFAGWVARPDPVVNPDWFAAPAGGFEMPIAGRLDVCRYLDASREAFAGDGGYVRADLDPAADLELAAAGVRLPRLGVAAGRVVFCQGFDGVGNPWFAGLRYGGAKGEVLTLRIPGLGEDRVVHRGVWLAPVGGDLFLAGSTYTHDPLDGRPTAAGRQEICGRLREFVRPPVEVVGHRAAVRPVVRAGRPVLGLHPADPRVGVFTGLGSKGALLAPFFAGQFADFLAAGGPVDPEVDVRRAV